MTTENSNDIRTATVNLFLSEVAKRKWEKAEHPEDPNAIGFFCGFDYVVNVRVNERYIDLADDADPFLCLHLTDEEFKQAMCLLAGQFN